MVLLKRKGCVNVISAGKNCRSCGNRKNFIRCEKCFLHKEGKTCGMCWRKGTRRTKGRECTFRCVPMRILQELQILWMTKPGVYTRGEKWGWMEEPEATLWRACGAILRALDSIQWLEWKHWKIWPDKHRVKNTLTKAQHALPCQ